MTSLGTPFIRLVAYLGWPAILWADQDGNGRMHDGAGSGRPHATGA